MLSADQIITSPRALMPIHFPYLTLRSYEQSAVYIEVWPPAVLVTNVLVKLDVAESVVEVWASTNWVQAKVKAIKLMLTGLI